MQNLGKVKNSPQMSRKSENRSRYSGFRGLGGLSGPDRRRRPNGQIEIWSPPIVPYCTGKGGRQLLTVLRSKNGKSTLGDDIFVFSSLDVIFSSLF